MTAGTLIAERNPYQCQFSLFDKPKQIKKDIRRLTEADYGTMRTIEAKQIGRRGIPDMWVRRAIVRGFVELMTIAHTETIPNYDSWLLTEHPNLGGAKPIDLARDNWEIMQSWITKTGRLPRQERVELLIGHFAQVSPGLS